MRVLITGGCKNGKSSFAQRVAVSQGERRVYVATMAPHDEEDRECIRRHLAARAGLAFETAEISRGIESVCGLFPSGSSLLIDSVTTLLAEEMFPEGQMDEAAPVRVAQGLLNVCNGFENVVFVSDSVGSDARHYDAQTDCFRSSLALLERTLAGSCELAVEMCFGRPTVWKGHLPLFLAAKDGDKKGNGMVLIVGGAHQGKRAFAMETLGFAREKIFANTHEEILAMLDAGVDPVSHMEALAAQWEDGAILLEDICCGGCAVGRS